MSILKQIATVDPKPPSELRADVPPDVEAILRKMMAKQIEDRYQSMEQVAAALTDILKDQKAGTEESGMLEATRHAVRQQRRIEPVEATETMTVPGRRRQKPLDEDYTDESEEAYHYEPVASRRRSRSAKAKNVRARADQRKKFIAAGTGGVLLLAVIVFMLIPGTRDDVTTTTELPAETTSKEDAGWTDLFNGTDFTAWRVIGHDGWSVENGVIIGETTSAPGCLMSDAQYGDFELELDYFLTSGSNSGIFLRAWPDGAVNGREFDEIQLIDDTSPDHAGIRDLQRTGALFGRAAPDPVLRPKPDEWHQLRIRAVGKQVNVWIDGTQVLAASLTTGKRLQGHIGLQLYPKKVQFRSIRIREIPSTGTASESSIDLIALLKPERDFLHPEITLSNGRIHTPRSVLGTARALVVIPQTVPQEYDLDLQVERKSEAGLGLNIGIVMGGKQGVVCMDSASKTAWCLENIDGQSIHSSGNPTVNPGRRLKLNQIAKVSIRVRSNRVAALLDGETIFDWTGKPDQLSIWSEINVPNKDSLFFYSQAEFEIHGMTLTPRSEIPPGRTSDSLSAVDLLPLVNLRRDAGVGTWKQVADGIACENPAGANVLQLPYEPPVEYDLEIEFTPTANGMNVNHYLAAQGSMFAWKLHAHGRTPPLYGFELLDGKYCKDFAEAAVQLDLPLKVGQRYRSVVEVRQGSLRTLLDGKQLVHWTGDFKRFSVEESTPMQHLGRIGIGSWKRAVTFHSVRVREISGKGKLLAATTTSAR